MKPEETLNAVPPHRLTVTPAVGFLIALSIFILDQLTKYFVLKYVGPFDVITILPFFNIIYAENIGSAFSMFKSLGNTFFIVVASLAMVFVSVLLVKDRDNRLVFSLVLGGAAGNLMDRIIRGHVVDFLDVYAGRYHWPTFNVADSALTIGIVLLVYKTFFGFRKGT